MHALNDPLNRSKNQPVHIHFILTQIDLRSSDLVSQSQKLLILILSLRQLVLRPVPLTDLILIVSEQFISQFP